MPAESQARAIEVCRDNVTEVTDMSLLPFVVVGSCVLPLLFGLAAVGAVAVREWWWNFDRSRRVVMMLGRERTLDEAAAFAADRMAAQLDEIRALPEAVNSAWR
jgi:hypothetical protein